MPDFLYNDFVYGVSRARTPWSTVVGHVIELEGVTVEKCRPAGDSSTWYAFREGADVGVYIALPHGGSWAALHREALSQIESALDRRQAQM